MSHNLPTTLRVKIAVAYDTERAISKDGVIPWHMPADLRHFRVITWGCPVIMGRKTAESLPGPLEGRLNIVLSRSAMPDGPGLVMTQSFDEALAIAAERMTKVQPWVIGGADVYKQALASGLVSEVVATEVEGTHGGDLFFPELPGEWTRKPLCINNDFQIVSYKPVVHT